MVGLFLLLRVPCFCVVVAMLGLCCFLRVAPQPRWMYPAKELRHIQLPVPHRTLCRQLYSSAVLIHVDLFVSKSIQYTHLINLQYRNIWWLYVHVPCMFNDFTLSHTFIQVFHTCQTHCMSCTQSCMTVVQLQLKHIHFHGQERTTSVSSIPVQNCTLQALLLNIVCLHGTHVV